MRRLLKRIDAALTAVAFAEEGEVETARSIAADVTSDPPAPTPRAPRARDDAGRSPPLRPQRKIARLP